MLKLLRSIHRSLFIGLIAATLFSFAGKQLLAVKLAALPFYPESGISNNSGSHHNGSRTLMHQINVQAQEISNKGGKFNSNFFQISKLKTSVIAERTPRLDAFARWFLKDSSSIWPLSLRI